MITDWYHTVSNNGIEGKTPEFDHDPEDSPDSPSPHVVIHDTDDSGIGDKNYTSREDLDASGSDADNDQSVKYDSGLEENPHSKGKGKQLKNRSEDSDDSGNSDSRFEENPRTNQKRKGKGSKGQTQKKKKKVNLLISLSSWWLTHVHQGAVSWAASWGQPTL